MPTSFEIFAHTLAKADKAKNGDACDYTVLESTKDQALIVLALADGVGGKPCDYLASATAVNAFLEHFANNKETDLKTRMQQACLHADDSVIKAPEKCAGMLATLVAVVWEVATNQIHFTSIGDSRIYLQRQRQINQLTEDDAIEKTNKAGGQTQLRNYITRIIGSGEVQFDIQTQPFFPGDVCWLASDGFYLALSETKSELLDLWKYQYFEKGCQELFNSYTSHYQDDASVVALRRNDVSDQFLTNAPQWLGQKPTLSLPANLEHPALTRIIFDHIQIAFNAHNISTSLHLLELLEDLEIYPELSSVEQLLQTFQDVSLNNSEVYKAIRRLLMKTV